MNIDDSRYVASGDDMRPDASGPPNGFDLDAETIDRTADALRAAYGFGFVGVSVVSGVESKVFRWDFGSGSPTGNYRMIRLPAGVGALGKAYELGCCLIAENIADDIPETERFQYPIVAVEALKSFFTFPLYRGDDIVLVLICASRFVRYFDDAFVGEVQQRAAQLFGLETSHRPIMRIHGKQKGFAYGELPQRILNAQEDERKRIARELHDGLSQEVLVAQMGLRQMKYLPSEQWPDQVEVVSSQLRDVISHIGAMAKSLRPASLDELGLAVAARELCRSCESAFGIPIVCSIEDNLAMDEAKELVAYRVLQESLTNACKYAEPTRIDVIMSKQEGVFHLAVCDNGKGFDTERPAIKGGGLGLEGMRERASLIGADFLLTSQLGKGTCVTLNVKCGDAR
ncbi:MAG: ATP-binding protein [Eggerthellaceae bacterium]|jgi:two-component system sensor histidine kinase NreB